MVGDLGKSLWSRTVLVLFFEKIRPCVIIGETEQIQQMFNMDKDQAIIQTPLMDTEEDEMTITPIETRDNLNL